MISEVFLTVGLILIYLLTIPNLDSYYSEILAMFVILSFSLTFIPEIIFFYYELLLRIRKKIKQRCDYQLEVINSTQSDD